MDDGAGTGHLATNAANRSVAFMIVACVAGAVFLVVAALGAVRGRRGLAAIVPLALVLIGCIGEPIYIAAGNPPAETSSAQRSSQRQPCPWCFSFCRDECQGSAL